MSPTVSLLRSVSTTDSESPGETMPSPPPTSLTAVDSWWMSSTTAEAAAGSAQSAASAATTTLRGRIADLIGSLYRQRTATPRPAGAAIQPSVQVSWTRAALPARRDPR